MEVKENQEQVPAKIQTILDSLKREQGQEGETPEMKTKMEISTNVLVLAGYGQLWENRPQLGTKDEADMLMKLGFKKMKDELYKGKDINLGIDYSIESLIKRRDDPQKISADPVKESERIRLIESSIDLIKRNK